MFWNCNTITDEVGGKRDTTTTHKHTYKHITSILTEPKATPHIDIAMLPNVCNSLKGRWQAGHYHHTQPASTKLPMQKVMNAHDTLCFQPFPTIVSILPKP